ncbi:MAG TPA: phenylacetate-CoA oxygenase subunit PaaJ [Bacteroidia bacterium]|jgi:ring-1,2-phenylacetyl-CoA epoxidase subunit PaaD|nr:phenylacetate-CoA oxygenase subunit PaaJ [Bacteroidia bacterium]
MKNKEEIIRLLAEIPDPEIPVITIQELGVLRDVAVNENTVEITITPTYSGCPAMKQIENDIVSKLKNNGIENVKIKMVYHPAWTTDWIPQEAKEKLKRYGIAPPEKTSIDKGILSGKKKICPHCGSNNTEMVSQFGSTACKALYKCLDCKEPFDYFKCH